MKVGSKPVEAFLGIKYGVYEPFNKPKLYEYSAGSEIGKLNDNLKICKLTVAAECMIINFNSNVIFMCKITCIILIRVVH